MPTSFWAMPFRHWPDHTRTRTLTGELPPPTRVHSLTHTLSLKQVAENLYCHNVKSQIHMDAVGDWPEKD